MKVITRTLDTRHDITTDEVYAELPDDLGTVQAVLEAMTHGRWQVESNSRFRTLSVRIEL